MRAWRKSDEPQATDAVTRAAVRGVTREQLLQKALSTLSRDGRADRIGAWVESAQTDGDAGASATSFRGAVWDRENANVLPEWQCLSPEAVLPSEVLTAGRTVEQEMEGGTTMIGPLVGLRRALWVPVEKRGHLHGVLLAGSKGRHGAMPKELLEATAAELALAIAYEEEHLLAQERQADLALVRRILNKLNAGKEDGVAPGKMDVRTKFSAGDEANQGNTEQVLRELVENCTASAENNHSKTSSGLAAEFAAIGLASKDRVTANGIPEIDLRWTSGEAVWISAIRSSPAAEIWRKALLDRRPTGDEPHAPWMRQKVARIIAIPLEAEEKLLGVLIAGLRHNGNSYGMLERLELRAALAITAVDYGKRDQETKRQVAWRISLLESTSEATALLDADGRVTAISAGAKILLKGGEEQPIHLISENLKQPFAKLFQPADRDRISAWSERTLYGVGDRRGAPRSGPAESPEAVLNNGVKVRLRPAIPAGGSYAAVSLELHREFDLITADGHTKAELLSVLECVSEGIILFDAQENVRACNTRFLQLMGLRGAKADEIATLDGLISRISEHVAEPASFERRWRDLARGIDGGIREELELVWPNSRAVQRAARPIVNLRGRRLGRIEIYRDLTAQRGSQMKLVHTEKLAALGQLITGIAHELSSPLTSILVYGQRLLQRSHTAENDREIRKISEEAERASTILRQLLLNAQDRKPELRRVALNQMVQQAMEVQQASLANENITIQMDLDPDLPLVHGDAGRLQQVLMNLTGNARQALDQRGHGGTIRIRTKQIGDRRVLLEIADDGPGIPKEILERIFDPFFTTKPTGAGTGLGLAIVLSIVQEHGGHINVTSPPNGGAIFSIALRAAGHTPVSSHAFRTPAGVLQTDIKNVETYKSEVAAGGILPQSGNRILVVEDEPIVARLIADVLEGEGFRVDVLLDGHEALERVQRETYDLVICDMKMPGLDGQQFYEALVRVGNLLSERFLFVTGDVVSTHTHEFMERHRLPHLAKPFRMEELKERVREMLARVGFPWDESQERSMRSR